MLDGDWEPAIAVMREVSHNYDDNVFMAGIVTDHRRVSRPRSCKG
jgi:hypothetical protein